ncbi:LysR family transcriptional regulator [Pelomonas sp. KK5]|uniref:LysR family transcriptional regulator n=1 Tax=Pelomonas sp. KK5 TaxID=1855730 RepID=UPI00097C6A49|nr:LysR family transcriptional regulator [Pelomonas sp. KK5]
MSAPDLNLLTALDALLAEGSVARAAARLNLSESAMSRTLARLREATGDELLVRAGRAMVPTPHALALRERVSGLAQEARAVLQPAGARLDIATLQRRFTLRANDGFIEAFAPRLAARAAAEAPGLQLRFAPKPDKDTRPLREGLIDLDIGVLGEHAGPELRVQALYRDRFVAVVRDGHALLADGRGSVDAARYAACGHVVTSRRGRPGGPVDEGLAALGLSRRVAVIVPSFRAALAIAAESDLVALVPASYFAARQGGLQTFELPVETAPITISQMWHPRFERDPAHQWLRGLMLELFRNAGAAAPATARAPAPAAPDRHRR